MKTNATSIAIGLVVMLGIGALPALADDVPLRQITVDADVKVGVLRPLSGIQAVGGVDGTALFKAARIDLIRIDAVLEPGDANAIFTDMSADAENPKSYNFVPSDRLVASIKSAGAEPLFRIGRSSGAANPPADLDKFAQIAR